MRTSVRALAAALVGAYLVVGTIWLARHLGEVPHYGDTTNYLIYARQAAVNEHRGFLYPVLLAALGGDCLAAEGPTYEGLRAEERLEHVATCAYPDCWLPIQLLQSAAFLAALGYFLAVVTRSRAGPPGSSRAGLPETGLSKAGVALLALVVAVDPLVAHFNLALMTDGLATAGALVLCAAFHAFLAARPGDTARRLVHGSLLVLGAFVTSGMRVEKGWIVVAATAAASATWIFVKRRGNAAWTAGTGRRLAVAGVLVLAAVALARGAQNRYQTVTDDWWSLGETTVHFRVIYPHLSRVYDHLPAFTRARLSRDDAARYDREINEVRRVVNRISEGDEEARRRLTDEMARTVVRHRWRTLIVDVGHDFLSNALATYSAWTDPAMRELWKSEAVRNSKWAAALRPWLSSGSGYWNFTRLTGHHQRWIARHLRLSWLLIGVATLVGVVAVARRPRSRVAPFSAAALLAWSPALWFWFFNAAAFALSVNNYNYRYMIFSHVMILCLLLLAGLRTMRSEP